MENFCVTTIRQRTVRWGGWQRGGVTLANLDCFNGVALQGPLRVNAASHALACECNELFTSGRGSDLPILFRVLFPNTVISVVLEQHVRRRVSHLKRRHVRVLKIGNVVTAE